MLFESSFKSEPVEYVNDNADPFRLFPPPHYVMQPPVTEDVSLQCKSLCKNMASASRGANNMHPLSWGGGGGGEGTNGKDVIMLHAR